MGKISVDGKNIYICLAHSDPQNALYAIKIYSGPTLKQWFFFFHILSLCFSCDLKGHEQT